MRLHGTVISAIINAVFPLFIGPAKPLAGMLRFFFLSRFVWKTFRTTYFYNKKREKKHTQFDIGYNIINTSSTERVPRMARK